MLTLEDDAVAVADTEACAGVSEATHMVQPAKAASDAKITFFIRIAMISVYSPADHFTIRKRRGLLCHVLRRRWSDYL